MIKRLQNKQFLCRFASLPLGACAFGRWREGVWAIRQALLMRVQQRLGVEISWLWVATRRRAWILISLAPRKKSESSISNQVFHYRPRLSLASFGSVKEIEVVRKALKRTHPCSSTFDGSNTIFGNRSTDGIVRKGRPFEMPVTKTKIQTQPLFFVLEVVESLLWMIWFPSSESGIKNTSRFRRKLRTSSRTSDDSSKLIAEKLFEISARLFSAGYWSLWSWSLHFNISMFLPAWEIYNKVWVEPSTYGDTSPSPRWFSSVPPWLDIWHGGEE